MYTQIVYEHSVLGHEDKLTHQTRMHLNLRVNQRLTTKLNEDFFEHANRRMGLDATTGQEIKPVFSDVRETMLEAERRKAEALNMLRLRETLR